MALPAPGLVPIDDTVGRALPHRRPRVEELDLAAGEGPQDDERLLVLEAALHDHGENGERLGTEHAHVGKRLRPGLDTRRPRRADRRPGNEYPQWCRRRAPVPGLVHRHDAVEVRVAGTSRGIGERSRRGGKRWTEHEARLVSPLAAEDAERGGRGRGGAGQEAQDDPGRLVPEPDDPRLGRGHRVGQPNGHDLARRALLSAVAGGAHTVAQHRSVLRPGVIVEAGLGRVVGIEPRPLARRGLALDEVAGDGPRDRRPGEAHAGAAGFRGEPLGSGGQAGAAGLGPGAGRRVSRFAALRPRAQTVVVGRPLDDVLVDGASGLAGKRLPPQRHERATVEERALENVTPSSSAAEARATRSSRRVASSPASFAARAARSEAGASRSWSRSALTFFQRSGVISLLIARPAPG